MRTDAIVRARDVMINYFGWRFNHTQGRATELTTRMLKTALNREDIAKALFLEDTRQPNREFAAGIWDNASNNSRVRRHYLDLAEAVIKLVIGQQAPSTTTTPPTTPQIHITPNPAIPPMPMADQAAQTLARYGATPRPYRNQERP